MWALEGVDAATATELTVPGARHPRSALVVVHRTLTLPGVDVCTKERLAVTRPARTIVDLASLLDEEHLETALECARRRRLVRDEDLRRRLDALGGRGRLGAAQLRAILDAVEGHAPAEFPLEVKVARFLRETTLPEPVRQHRVRMFGRRYRLDFAWPHVGLALECDGRRYHDFEKDRTRWRHLSAAGWRVLPVTWRDVTRGWDAIVDEIHAALTKAT
jgi:very-short-patch-repair endonuclease